MLLISCTKEEAKPDPMSGGALIGVNYTEEGIQWFSVDEAGGGGINPYSVSGDFCCTMYPKKWNPDLKVNVEWERSDGREPDGKRWKLKVLKKTIPIEEYTELGRIYVTFLPKDEVRVYISNVGPSNENFPSKLGFPEEPAKTKRTMP